ncbi:hydroxypyruvate isomerase family protein [Solirubrobacter soli]|uniref:hydroxypyruvate isomerase family protein n=1 Tax=Solirubrobacter soli TaxID=363832 RepID=UPI00041F3BB8|nr:TIM barrel protein [Solirubrobacter soli]
MRFAANVSMLFTELPFAARFEAAIASGFEGVEFWWTTEPVPPGFEVVLMNFDGGDLAAGERGIVSDPPRWRAHVPEAVALARSLGCRRMNALVGRDDGRPLEAQLAGAAEEVAFAARAAAPITVLVEAINTHDVPGYLVSSTAAAADFVARVGEPNVGIQFDVFHMTRMGEDVEAALRAHRDLIAHVQIADHPGRGEPGTGTIDFDALFALLAELGYDGWVSAEWLPTP